MWLDQIQQLKVEIVKVDFFKKDANFIYVVYKQPNLNIKTYIGYKNRYKERYTMLHHACSVTQAYPTLMTP